MSIVEYKTELITRYGSSLLTKEQASGELQISQCQLDRLRKSGELGFVRVGSLIRIPVEALVDFLL